MVGSGPNKKIKVASVEENPKEKLEILNLVLKELEIKTPVKIMLARRLVDIWQRINYIDEQIRKQGVFFKKTNDNGETTYVGVNQLAFYQKQLDAELRSYYRILNQKWNKPGETREPETFFQLLENEQKKEDNNEAGHEEGNK
jgi:hypothetical protein